MGGKVGVGVGQGVGISVGVLVGLGVGVSWEVGLRVGVQIGGEVAAGVGDAIGVEAGAGDGCVRELMTTAASVPRTIMSASASAATMSHFFRDTGVLLASLYGTGDRAQSGEVLQHKVPLAERCPMKVHP